MGLDAHPLPSTDTVFQRVVESTAAESASPADLAGRLRPMYPDVEVVERGLSGERARYYVYRDGAFTVDAPDGWWREPGMPFAEVDVATARFTFASEQLLRLLRRPAEAVIGRAYREIVPVEARATADEIWRSVIELGDVQSEVVVAGPDGKRDVLEFRAFRTEDVVHVYYRQAPPRGRRRRQG